MEIWFQNINHYLFGRHVVRNNNNQIHGFNAFMQLIRLIILTCFKIKIIVQGSFYILYFLDLIDKLDDYTGVQIILIVTFCPS